MLFFSFGRITGFPLYSSGQNLFNQGLSGGSRWSPRSARFQQVLPLRGAASIPTAATASNSGLSNADLSHGLQA